MQISVLILIINFETFFKINQKYLSRINEFTSPLNAFEKAYNIKRDSKSGFAQTNLSTTRLFVYTVFRNLCLCNLQSVYMEIWTL